MTHSTSNAQNGCCSRHTFWTWLLAILLAIYLYWHWQHGHGPAFATTCCTANVVPLTTPETTSAFSFTASNAHGYNATGDASNVAWAAKSAELSTWFNGGADWVITGDANKVTLSGTVDSEGIKQAKAAEAQAFFGTAITIDNQLTVKATEAATATAPAPVKLYFDTGKTTLPADASQTLVATIDWLKANSSAKAIISGYSDPRGNHVLNAELSKNRAKAVREMLKSAGIDDARIEMRKPETVEAGGDLAEARRVEVSVE
jgi:outer membrane protein OmpA-like peptidoglycan-associated protein